MAVDVRLPVLDGVLLLGRAMRLWNRLPIRQGPSPG